MHFDELTYWLFRKMSFEWHARTGKMTVEIAILYLFAN